MPTPCCSSKCYAPSQIYLRPGKSIFTARHLLRLTTKGSTTVTSGRNCFLKLLRSSCIDDNTVCLHMRVVLPVVGFSNVSHACLCSLLPLALSLLVWLCMHAGTAGCLYCLGKSINQSALWPACSCVRLFVCLSGLRRLLWCVGPSPALRGWTFAHCFCYNCVQQKRTFLACVNMCQLCGAMGRQLQKLHLKKKRLCLNIEQGPSLHDCAVHQLLLGSCTNKKPSTITVRSRTG